MPKKNGADRSKTESQISLEDILSRRQPRARDEAKILYGCRPPETSIENRIEDENWIKRQRLILDDSSAKKK